MHRDPRPPRRLRRDREGNLFDVEEQRRVDVAELVEDVRGGRRFRVRHHDSDVDCTQQVLLQVLGTAALPSARMTEPGGALPGIVGSLASALHYVHDGDDHRARKQARVAADRRRREDRPDSPFAGFDADDGLA